MSETYKQGDIVLIPYPYDDLTGTKRRPVIVVSSTSDLNNSFIVAKITSVIRYGANSFLLKNQDLDAVLTKTSEVRTNHIFTANNSLVIKKIARLKKAALIQLTNQIKANFEVF